MSAFSHIQGASKVVSFPEGFETDVGFDPSEDFVGPFYWREADEGFHCAFMPDERHCNNSEIVHGGILMMFADYSLCLAATDHYNGEDCVTVSFSSEFVSGAELGHTVECLPKVVRKTGSMAFITGELTSNDEVVMTFSSVVKRLRET